MSVKSIVLFECSICKRRYDTEQKAKGCLIRCTRFKVFEKKYPEVKDKHCDFANGGGWIKRDLKWHNDYCLDLQDLINTNHPDIAKEHRSVLDGNMGRFLDDCHYDEYGLWGRLLSICKKCFKEWGQPYYALRCHHDGSTDEGFGGAKRSVKKLEWIEPKPKRMNPSER